MKTQSRLQMMNKGLSSLKILASIVTLAVVVSTFGFACSTGLQGNSLDNSSAGFDLPSTIEIPPATSGIPTVGVPILGQTYATLFSALQVVTPTTQSRDEFNRQSGNFSDSGQPGTLGSPLALAFSTLAGQVCLDRIAFESNANNAANKVLFNSINLAAAPANNVNDANLGVAINRIARSIWQRNESAEERQILTTAVNESMALDNQNNANKTQEAALFLCTAMASALNGVQQ
ncbi:MAG: hypothetical protein AB7N80_11955 [Bdellovibrionales bacterium]